MNRGNDNGFGDWGGYMDAKITKLEEQFTKSGDSFKQTNLFAGISIFVNGLTNPSSDELKRIMMVHGGIYHHYQRSHTTYIIASNLPDVKVRNMNTTNIISPQWVVDCVKENKVLDYKRYLLYTNHKPSQPKINFKSKDESIVEDKKSIAANILKELEVLNQKMKKPPECKEQLSDTLNMKPMSPELFEEDDPKDQKLLILGQKQNDETNKSLIAPTKYAKSAVDPNFLSEFYNNSRLHHISTLGAGFKQYISELREKNTDNFPERENLKEKIPKMPNPKIFSQTIMHIDMDCFFVSVGLRTRPHLRGQPIAVTHSKGNGAAVRPGADRQLERELYLKRFEKKFNENEVNEKIKHGFDGTDSLSEIASCSYEARKMGLHNGMMAGHALKLCPQLKTIPYDFDGYKEVAFTLYNTMAQYTLNIEAVSCDEMFVDLTELLNDLQVETMDFVAFVRSEVKRKTDCPCSAGVGGNRLQARMATKKAKPDGQYFLSPESVEEYMANIPISDLPGVGYNTSYTLKQMNLKTCGDLHRMPLANIQKEIGKKFGETLYQFCRGIDNRPLVYGQIRKSVSAEVNYGIRFTEFEELEKFLKQLCTEVHSRLTDIKRRGKCITLKLMIRSKDAPTESSKYMGHGVCDHLSKSTSLSDFTADLSIITKTIINLMKSLSIPPKELRGIGIQISKLDDPSENKAKKDNVIKSMFSKVAEKKKDQNQLQETLPPKTQAEKRKSPSGSPEKPHLKIAKKTRNKIKQTSSTTKSLNIGNMLQITAQKSITTTTTDIPEGIDYSVLSELPEDIREEVLRDYRKVTKFTVDKNKTPTLTHSNALNDPKSIEVDQEFLAALPPELREEVEKEIEIQKDKLVVTKSDKNIIEEKTISEGNIFDQIEWRQLLESWVESEDFPEEYDVEMLAQNAQEFVRNKKISDLYVPLKLLYRIIGNKGNCHWHKAYKTIYNSVQTEMITVYGSKMFLKEHFDCDCCCIK